MHPLLARDATVPLLVLAMCVLSRVISANPIKQLRLSGEELPAARAGFMLCTGCTKAPSSVLVLHSEVLVCRPAGCCPSSGVAAACVSRVRTCCSAMHRSAEEAAKLCWPRRASQGTPPPAGAASVDQEAGQHVLRDCGIEQAPAAAARRCRAAAGVPGLCCLPAGWTERRPRWRQAARCRCLQPASLDQCREEANHFSQSPKLTAQAHRSIAQEHSPGQATACGLASEDPARGICVARAQAPTQRGCCLSSGRSRSRWGRCTAAHTRQRGLTRLVPTAVKWLSVVSSHLLGCAPSSASKIDTRPTEHSCQSSLSNCRHEV